MKWYSYLVVLLVCMTPVILYLVSPSDIEYINSKEYKLSSIESNNIYTLYRYYSEIERFPTEDYAVYVLDPYDDEYLLERFPEVSIQSVRSFIYDNITYESEDGEYPKFPVETLYEGSGDCEDIAILGASLLSIHGYNVSLVKNNGHMVIKVEDKFIPDSIEIIKEYPVEPRPIVFHYWGEVLEKKTKISSHYSGYVYVENRGSESGNITLSISGFTESIIIEPFTKLKLDFNVNKPYLETTLYLDGEKVDENKPVSD